MPYFLAPIWKTALEPMAEEELWDHYKKCLRAYDWYYIMSDDNDVWQAGEDQYNHLRRVAERVHRFDRKRADKLYCSACPWLNEDGSRKDGM